MTTNQTIDGVPRKSLEQALKLAAVFDDGGDGADAESARGVVWILRALLDAPADPKPTGLSQGWNLTRKQDGFVVGHQSWVYPPDEKDIQRAERGGYVWVPFLLPASQPQGEPVEDCETFEYQLEMLGAIDRCDVACGSYGDKFHRWDDAGPYVEYEDHVKHIELYKREIERLSKLYAEQLAPVAVSHLSVTTLRQRFSERA